MDPFTVALVAAIGAAVKGARDQRDAAKRTLLAWDATLESQRGKAGTRMTIPAEVRKALATAKGDHCAYRNVLERCSGTLTVDHRVPLKAGGYNYSDNLQLVCGRHNSSKRDRSDLEYRRGGRRGGKHGQGRRHVQLRNRGTGGWILPQHQDRTDRHGPQGEGAAAGVASGRTLEVAAEAAALTLPVPRRGCAPSGRGSV